MKTEEKEINTLFEWLTEITLHKTPPDGISENSWKHFNSFMVHRYLSMCPEYIELVNYVQRIPYDQNKQIYSIYKEMIPQRKVWLKYIGSKKKTKNQSAVDYVAKYFECSLGEAEEYMDILREHGVRGILYKMGIEDKEIEKLLK